MEELEEYVEGRGTKVLYRILVVFVTFLYTAVVLDLIITHRPVYFWPLLMYLVLANILAFYRAVSTDPGFCRKGRPKECIRRPVYFVDGTRVEEDFSSDRLLITFQSTSDPVYSAGDMKKMQYQNIYEAIDHDPHTVINIRSGANNIAVCDEPQHCSTSSNEWRPELTFAQKYCYICENFKPHGTGHCLDCGHCIMEKDHHCLWLANCIGRNNIRFFYIFLFTFILITCYSCVAVRALLRVFFHLKPSWAADAAIFIVPLLLAAVAIASSLFFFYNIFLVLINESSRRVLSGAKVNWSGIRLQRIFCSLATIRPPTKCSAGSI